MARFCKEQLIFNETEQAAFSGRLLQALKCAGYQDCGPTVFTRNFNVRFPEYAVTIHAARKWLVGESIPNQTRLTRIANWLSVKPDWLRFGSEVKKTSGNDQMMSMIDQTLLGDLQRLTANDRILVNELIRILLLHRHLKQ